ncbi:MAG: TldD/PmbA family protein [Thermoplasmata archaeon]
MAPARSEAFDIVDRVLDLSPADQTEAILLSTKTSLTRYANSIIHQNVATSDTVLILRLVYDKQIGIVRTNRTDEASIKESIERAGKMARAQKPNKEFVSLPEDEGSEDVPNFSAKTDGSTPEERAKVVEDIVSIVSSQGVEKAFGALEAATRSITVSNSLGIRAHNSLTLGHLVVTAIKEANGEKGYGWGEDLKVDISKLDHRRMAERAAEKAAGSIGAKAIEPGEYTVVLESNAVADMVQSLASITFGAIAYQEGRSYVSGNLGQKVTGESITLWDEGTRPEGVPVPFDGEGVPKKRVLLLESGVARGVVYDSYTAGREGKKTTGHALLPPNPIGPLAMNTFLETGDSSEDEMVAETKRGIYVTRFHYTNPIDAPKALITGMTRDGTFLIENGEIRGAVKNLRFTQGLMEAFAEATLIGKEREPHRYSSWLGVGASTVPPVKIENFRFTGVTEF